MMKNLNQIKISGTIDGYPRPYRNRNGLKTSIVTVRWKKDWIDCLIKTELCRDFRPGDKITLLGEIITRDEKHLDGSNKLLVYVDVHRILGYTGEEMSDVCISGRVVKVAPFYYYKGNDFKQTIIVAVTNGTKSNYLAVCAWNSSTRKLKNVKYGDNIKVSGRIHSRTYTKTVKTGNKYQNEICTATEIEIRNLKKEAAYDKD